MGTSWSLAAYVPPTTSPDAIGDRISALFAELNAVFSTWDATSFISRFNAASPGTQFTAPATFRHVLDTAIDIADRSSAAFNPALGADIVASGYGSPLLAQVTGTRRTWSDARPHLASPHLIQPGGLLLDLSAIAKGFAVDELARLLEGFGATSLLAEIGGECLGRGLKHDAHPWWIEIERADPSQSPWRAALCNQALATSGNAHAVAHAPDQDGSHIVSASDDSQKQQHSVTILHPSCMTADAWATALFATAPQLRHALAEREGLAALFQFTDAEPHLSPVAAAMLD